MLTEIFIDNPITFLTLFNNAVIHLNLLLQKLLSEDKQTDGKTEN
jgi:hypothetical protein